MIKNNVAIKYFFSLLFCLVIFQPAQGNEKQYHQLQSEFVQRLKSGGNIGSLLSRYITFVYYSDNRCDGSTEGVVYHLLGMKIDQIIRVPVSNDGNGWSCEKRKTSDYLLVFKLSEKLNAWDRFESEMHSLNPRVFYIKGGGESDYLVFHIREIKRKLKVHKIEYRSEDPG